MENYYNLEGIKAHLTKELARAEAFRDAWAAVTYPTKKDGQPFATLSKNIKGASYTQKAYGTKGECELTVYTQATGCGYIHDSIDCYKNAQYASEEQKAKPQNIIKRPPFVDAYIYDLDDIKAAVKRQAERYAERAEELKRQLEECERVYAETARAWDAFNEELSRIYKPFTTNTMYYAVVGTVTRGRL
jgi:hypothetical protein